MFTLKVTNAYYNSVTLYEGYINHTGTFAGYQI